MSLIKAIIQSRQRGEKIKWTRKATLLDSICYSHAFVSNCYYYRFSSDGQFLFGLYLSDEEEAYLVVWRYNPRKRLSPYVCLGKVPIHETGNRRTLPSLSAKDFACVTSTVFQLIGTDVWISLAYETLSPTPHYLLSYTLGENNHFISISNTMPCNNPFGTIQLDSKLITVHRNDIVCFLPSSETLIGIIIPIPISQQHLQAILSPEDYSRFNTVQMQRLYQYQPFPVLANKQSSLRFMPGIEKPIWCQQYDGCEIVQNRWTVTEDGMEVEEDNGQWGEQPWLLQELLHHQQYQQHQYQQHQYQQVQHQQHQQHQQQYLTLPTQFCIDLRSLLSCLFPATSIRHYVYIILQSTLCSPVCPAPHLLLALEVILLKETKSSSPQSKRSCYWLCLEIHFHPTTATPEWNIRNQWNMVYANVLDKRKDGSFIIEEKKDQRESNDRKDQQEQGEGGIRRIEAMEHRMACRLIQKHIQFILPKLYTSETGKPLEYRLQTSSKSDLRYLINLATKDIFIAPF